MLIIPLYRPLTPRLLMSARISPVLLIANGMGSPIGMASFPAMKTLEPDWIGNEPDMIRSQIVVLIANDADVFVSIPDVVVRNGCLHRHRRRRFDRHPNTHPHASVWPHDAAGHDEQGQSSAGYAQRVDNFISFNWFHNF
jgi:hypothetical protein